MIINERGVRVAREKVADLETARDASDDETERFVYEDLISEVRQEIDEYESIKAGLHRVFTIDGLDDLGVAIVKARMARGLTQRSLADELGVTEQNVQRDERREYEAAGLARLAEILDALEYEFVGTLRPRTRVSTPLSTLLSGDKNLGSGFSVSYSSGSSQMELHPVAKVLFGSDIHCRFGIGDARESVR